MKIQCLRTSVILLAFPLLTTIGVSSAHAADAKVYPGSMAIKYSGPTPTYSWSMVNNPSSTSWMYLDLPVINDDTTSGIDSSWVQVLDHHYSSDVRCSIVTVYYNNSADAIYGYFGPVRYSTGSSPNAQTLSTGSASHGSTRHEYFSCAIPPTYAGQGSSIVSYYVSE